MHHKVIWSHWVSVTRLSPLMPAKTCLTWDIGRAVTKAEPSLKNLPSFIMWLMTQSCVIILFLSMYMSYFPGCLLYQKHNVNNFVPSRLVYSDDNYPLIIGLGVGIPLSLLALLLVTICIVIACHRRRKRHSSTESETDRYVKIVYHTFSYNGGGIYESAWAGLVVGLC